MKETSVLNTDNKILIITAPSGAGKTSLAHYLLNKFSFLSFSVSATTRAPRAYEKNGVDYYFLSQEEFQHKIEQNEFVEWEMVYEGKYYGTLKTELQRIWLQNKIPLLDIDVQGAIHVQSQFLGSSFSIFVEPPSLEELKKRLESRATETPESIETRLNKAAYEMSFKQAFNMVLWNENFEKACRVAEEAVLQFASRL
jgi:guanylate kinase